MSNYETEVFNLAEALERVEGDRALLKEMADLFCEEEPRMLQAIERAITANDAQALQNAAHTLKGAVSNFAAGNATEASLTLEKMGRQRQLADATSALASLKHELARLSAVLATLPEKEAA